MSRSIWKRDSKAIRVQKVLCFFSKRYIINKRLTLIFMRIVLLYLVFILSIFSYTALFAADKYVPVIPSTAELKADWWYHLWNDRYKKSSPTPSSNISVDTSTNSSEGNILWIDDQDLRTGNVDMDTIPRAIVSIINILLWVAGTISVVALIYYAIQMQINSGITWDSSWVDNAKKWMRWAILGFVLAILAWFIIIRFIEILSGLS